jgi:putative Holliday junction resolvase
MVDETPGPPHGEADADADDEAVVAAAPVRGRVMGIDVGAKRTGIALSDASGTLARPHRVITSATPIGAIVEEIVRLQADDDGLAAVVVGMPMRLDGSANAQTAHVVKFVGLLRARVTAPVVTQDERLTSIEAESLLAGRERDWRRRKEKLDAAAAAVILQEYLDRRDRTHGA